jgi:NitT/TauT family transport system substrate-binding protein
MSQIKRIISVTIILLSLLAGTAVAEREQVRIAQFGKSKFLLYLPLYVAREEGFFEREGIAVDLSFAGNDDQVFAAVAAQQADFGVGDPVFSAIAVERGFEARTVALMIQRLAVLGYTRRSDIPVVSRIDELAGLRLSSFPAPSTTFTLLQGLRGTLPVPKQFEIVQGAPATQPALLAAGRVDVALDLEPAVAIAESQGARLVFDLAAFTDPQAITGLTTSKKLIDERPATVKKVVRALSDALVQMQKKPEVAQRVARKLFPEVEAATMERAVSRILGSGVYPSDTRISDALWQRSLRTRLESRDLTHPQPTGAAVEGRFAEEAVTASQDSE